MPLFKCFQLFWLKCWNSRKQHQTERLNFLFFTERIYESERWGKTFSPGCHWYCTLFLLNLSTLTSLVSPWAWNLPFLRTTRAHHSALIMAQVLCAAPLVTDKGCYQDFQSCWNFFYSLQVMGWSRTHQDTKPRGGQKVAEGRRVLWNSKGICAHAAQLCSKIWPWSLVEALLSVLWLLPCSTGLKLHQECKKSLLHHQAM